MNTTESAKRRVEIMYREYSRERKTKEIEELEAQYGRNLKEKEILESELSIFSNTEEYFKAFELFQEKYEKAIKDYDDSRDNCLLQT